MMREDTLNEHTLYGLKTYIQLFDEVEEEEKNVVKREWVGEFYRKVLSFFLVVLMMMMMVYFVFLSYYTQLTT